MLNYKQICRVRRIASNSQSVALRFALALTANVLIVQVPSLKNTCCIQPLTAPPLERSEVGPPRAHGENVRLCYIIVITNGGRELCLRAKCALPFCIDHS